VNPLSIVQEIVRLLFFELANKDIEVGIGEFRVPFMGFHIKSQSIPVES
jgi:hypothetical protein